MTRFTRSTHKALVTIPILALVCVVGCAPPPDRKTGPDAAVAAARYALHKHDLAGYYDALTDRAVRETLGNSIAICEFSTNPAVLAQMGAAGRNPSSGCETILANFGRIAVKGATSAERTRIRQHALQQVKHPRGMAAALEENHRRTGAGSSFVWDWLDDVKLKNIVIAGNTATAVATLSGDDQPVAFERDASGWRFRPIFEGTDAL